MNITATTAAAQAVGASTVPPPSSTTPASPTDALANESTFLKLLVAQIQNQDPLQPSDSLQYVTQLAQFSSLEQLIGIRQGISTLDQSVHAQQQQSAGAPPPAAATAPSANNQQQKISSIS